MTSFLKVILTVLLFLCTTVGAYAQGITKDDVGKKASFKAEDGNYIIGTITIVNPSTDPLDNYFVLEYTIETYGEQQSKQKVLKKFSLSKHDVSLVNTIPNNEASIGSVVLMPMKGGFYSEAKIIALYTEGQMLPDKFWISFPEGNRSIAWVVPEGKVDAVVEYTKEGNTYERAIHVNELFLPPTEPNAKVSVVPPVVPVPKTGYAEILNNMASSAVNNISMETAIKNNPEIYSRSNVLELLYAGLAEKTSATAEDYISKASYINNISNVLSEEEFSIVEHGLDIRLFKQFMSRVDKMPVVLNHIDDVVGFKVALVSTDYYRVEDATQEALFATLFRFSSPVMNGYISSVQDSEIVFGTPENEFKDGLLALMPKFDWTTLWSGTAIKMLNLLKIQLLGNNDVIATSTGDKEDVVTFLTTTYAVNNQSLAVEKYAYGLVTKDHFNPNNTNLLFENTIAIKNIDFDKALERFNRITEIVKK